MDLRQRRLTAEEWESLEITLPKEEMKILKLVEDGYHEVNKSFNDTMSLMNYAKLSTSEEQLYHDYFYNKYFKNEIGKLFQSKKRKKVKNKKKLKKADVIKISNSEKKIEKMKDVIYEFILLSIIKKLFLSKEEKSFHYYTLAKMCEFKISNINTLLLEDVKQILEYFKDTVKKKKLINKSTTFIERNSALKKYKDIALYSHQKQLFTLCKQPDPKLILYQAPTGTGKTISPLGLAQKHRIIFVCAAKHVGLQLAKSCISMGIKIAVAFGCEDPGGIRLHYFAIDIL